MVLTVITICYNNLSELLQTCRSVDAQSDTPHEHLIIDGSSDPEIKKFLDNTSQPVYRKWICERDNGIADAFNKGVRNASGDIIVMLNSGDKFYDDYVINKALNFFQKDPDLQWIHAKYELERGGQKVIIGKKFEYSKLYRGMRSICHQTMFIKKKMHEKYGLYDTTLSIAMDYDLLCRISKEKYIFTNAVFVSFAADGISSKQYINALRESKKVFNKYFGTNIKNEIWQFRLKFLNFLLTSSIGNFLYGIKKRVGAENL